MWIVIQLALSFWLASSITENVFIAAFLGIVLTFNISRGIYLTQKSLHKLQLNLNQKPHTLVPFDPANYLLANINQLIQRDGASLRDDLIQQTRAVAAQEERNRMARELHDSIKQQLFSINISSGAAVVQVEKNPTKAVEALQDVRLSVKAAMAEMNALLQQLSPAPLEKVGLEQAIRDQSEALAYRTGAQVEVEFDALPTEVSLRAGTQDALFRIVQEALSNIARHARADNVLVRLSTVEEHVQLVIKDDGQGFAKATSGMGLTNMQERVQALDGHVAVQSILGQGTTVHTTIPFNLDFQEEIMIDHTVNRVFLVGLVGGLLLLATLFIPFYYWLPSIYIDNWFASVGAERNLLTLLIVSVATVGILFGTGWLGAYWGRGNTTVLNMTFGAVAGSVATVLAYMALGTSAANVIGSRSILEHGFRAADNEEHMLSLLYESVGSIFLWVYSGMWLAFLLGIGIGALGGLFSLRREQEPNWRSLRLARSQVLRWTLISGAVNFPVGLVIFTQMVNSLVEIDGFQSTDSKLMAVGGGLLAIFTSVAFFLLPVLGTYWFQRRDYAAGHYHDVFNNGIEFGAIILLTTWLLFSLDTVSGLFIGVPTWLISVLFLLSAQRALQSGKTHHQHHAFKISGLIKIFFVILPFMIILRSGWSSTLFISVSFLVGSVLGISIKEKLVWHRGLVITSIIGALVSVAIGGYVYAYVALSLLTGLLITDLLSHMKNSDNTPLFRHDLSEWQSHIGFLLGIVVTITFTGMMIVSGFLPQALIVVNALPGLVSYEEDSTFVETPFAVNEAVNSLYLAQSTILLMIFGGALGFIGIITLVKYIIHVWQKRILISRKGLVHDTSSFSR